jgi:hypothetical protein
VWPWFDLSESGESPDPPYPVIYAAIAEYPSPSGHANLLALLLSRTAGESWERILIDQVATDYIGGPRGAQAIYNLAIGVQPDRLSRVYLGLVRVIGTENGLSAAVGRWGLLDFRAVGDPLKTHFDHHAWLVNAGQGVAYNGNDGGIWRVNFQFGRQNVAARWTNLNNVQLNTIQSWGAGGFPWNNTAVYIEASQDNGIARWLKRRRPLLNWDSQGGNDGGMILFDPMRAGIGYTWNPGVPTEIFFARQAEGADTWREVTGVNTDAYGLPRGDPDFRGFLNGMFLTPMALSPDGIALIIGTKRVSCAKCCANHTPLLLHRNATLAQKETPMKFETQPVEPEFAFQALSPCELPSAALPGLPWLWFGFLAPGKVTALASQTKSG